MSAYDQPTYESLFRAVSKRLQEEFVDNESPTPVVLWDNDTNDRRPQSLGDGITAADFWCRVSVSPGQSFVTQIGGGETVSRVPGVCTVQFFGDVGVGDGHLLAAADRCKAPFTGKTADRVRYRSPYVRRVGRSENANGSGGTGRWWQINLVIPFDTDFNVSTT